MVLQGFAGIAKDLTKISAKSAMTAMNEHQSGLFGAIALLTGAKNTLKGVGFFVGGLLFVAFGMRIALGGLAAIVAIGLGLTITLASTSGSAKIKQFAGIFAHSAAVNRLSVARFFLFGARDIWLAIALPLFMASAPGWGFWQSGAVMALYTIGYGVVQASTPASWPVKPPPTVASPQCWPAHHCWFVSVAPVWRTNSAPTSGGFWRQYVCLACYLHSTRLSILT